MQINSGLLLLTCVLIASPGLAIAQAPPSPANPPPRTAPVDPSRSPQGCAPTQTLPQQGTIAPQGTTTGQGETLSDRLAQSGGVLCPPAGVDPEIRAPTPDAGRTPVIPPPGSPGGDPSVRPK